MALYVTPVSPLPAVGFSVTLNDAGVTEISPGPYANTVEVQIYNPDTTDDIWVAFAPVLPVRARIEITVSNNEDLAPFPGDTVTVNGAVLTAAGGPFVGGANTFSVDIRAQGTIEVIDAPFPVGGTISILQKGGIPGSPLTYTCVAGPRAPGSRTFQSLAGTAAQAAEINAAFNDTPDNPGTIRSASVVGSTVTLIAGNNLSKRGANGNATALKTGTDTGLGLRTSELSFVTLGQFAGGVNADGGRTLQDGTVSYNTSSDYAANLLHAIITPPNTSALSFGRGQIDPAATNKIIIWAGTPGTAGDGLVAATSIPAVVTFNSNPSSGGVDLPAALTAATSIVVGPGQTRVLPIGREGERNPVQPASFWSPRPGANIGLVGQVETAGGSVAANITYVNRV